MRITSNTSGSMALFASGAILVAAFITGGVVDYMSLINQKHEVQKVADSSAIAAVTETTLSGQNERQLGAVARVMATRQLSGYGDVKVEARLLADGQGLEVTVTVPPRVFFPGPIGANATAISATAVAQMSGQPVCMIGLSPKAGNALYMQKKSAINAEGCAIYSNSTSKDGINISDSAKVTASFICSAGGVKTAKNYALDPAPLTDCPVIPDPLANRPEPYVGACDFTKFKVDEKTTVKLAPGVYCGGLEINGKAELKSGLYVIKNGELKVDKDGEIFGEHVGFFLTGDRALINLERKSTISLTAPKEGELAGLLFFESRKVEAADGGPVPGLPPLPPLLGGGPIKEHRIRSDNARKLVGTIYLPRNRLLIDGDKPIADRSEYTVILAREFALAEGPVIVLNTDYSLSDVPVPAGVGNQSKRAIKLVR